MGSTVLHASAANPLLRLSAPGRVAIPAMGKSVDATTRNPMFLFLLFGLFLLRFAQRAFLWLLMKEPPRNTRLC
jgi:hypothetical protein